MGRIFALVRGSTCVQNFSRQCHHYTGNVYGFEFPVPPNLTTKAIDSRPIDADTVTISAIAPLLAQRIHQLLSGEIDRAAGAWSAGVDGVTYKLIKQGSCAETWIPEPGTRAALVAELIEALATFGSKTPDQQKIQLTQLLGLLDRLEAQREYFEASSGDRYGSK